MEGNEIRMESRSFTIWRMNILPTYPFAKWLSPYKILRPFYPSTIKIESIFTAKTIKEEALSSWHRIFSWQASKQTSYLLSSKLTKSSTFQFRKSKRLMAPQLQEPFTNPNIWSLKISWTTLTTVLSSTKMAGISKRYWSTMRLKYIWFLDYKIFHIKNFLQSSLRSCLR